LDEKGFVIDAVRAYDVEEAKEYFIMFHGVEFVKKRKIICVPLLYISKDGFINLDSYYN